MALMSSRALGKLAQSCCVLAEREPWLPRGAQRTKVLDAHSVFMATNIAQLSFEQKGLPFRRWNHFLTIKQEKTFKSPFSDLHPTLPLVFT